MMHVCGGLVQDMQVLEPVVEATIITPITALGAITTCLKDRYGMWHTMLPHRHGNPSSVVSDDESCAA